MKEGSHYVLYSPTQIRFTNSITSYTITNQENGLPQYEVVRYDLGVKEKEHEEGLMGAGSYSLLT